MKVLVLSLVVASFVMLTACGGSSDTIAPNVVPEAQTPEPKLTVTLDAEKFTVNEKTLFIQTVDIENTTGQILVLSSITTDILNEQGFPLISVSLSDNTLNFDVGNVFTGLSDSGTASATFTAGNFSTTVEFNITVNNTDMLEADAIFQEKGNALKVSDLGIGLASISTRYAQQLYTQNYSTSAYQLKIASIPAAKAQFYEKTTASIDYLYTMPFTNDDDAESIIFELDKTSLDIGTFASEYFADTGVKSRIGNGFGQANIGLPLLFTDFGVQYSDSSASLWIGNPYKGEYQTGEFVFNEINLLIGLYANSNAD